MALTERLAILIDASSGGAVREFNKLSGAAGQTNTALTKTSVAAGALKGAIGAIGVTAVATGMVKFAQASIQAASALEEAQQKAEVVFGDSFPEIQTFAKDTADALNLSERAAYEMASAFGPMFKNAGFSAEAVGELSTAMTAFVADFASFNNLSLEQAFTKIQSGLAGETEAVRRYGINVSAAEVQSEAYAMGIAEVGDKLTETQKIQARTNIILKDGADAMGDVARTADSYANQQRNLAENTEEMAAAFGKALTPAVADATGSLADLAGAFADYSQATEESKNSALEFAGLSEDTTSLFDVYNQAVWKVYNALGFYSEAQREASDATEAGYEGLYDTATEALRAAGSFEAFAASSGTATTAAEEQAEAISDLAASIADMNATFRTADQASDDLTASIRDAREPFRDLEEAQADLAAATGDAERKTARQAVTAAKAALTMKGNSEAALENRDRLRSLADQTLDAASAFVELDGDTVRATAETERGRRAFIAIAQQLGLTKQEAREYANQLGLVPGRVDTNVQLNGITAAQAAAVGYKGTLDNIPRNVVTVIETRRRQATIGGPLSGDQSGLKRASGGPVSAGRAYMVGEQGPELLRLRGANGVITPASRTSDAQPPAKVTYNITAAPEDMLRQLRQAEKMHDLRRRVAA